MEFVNRSNPNNHVCPRAPPNRQCSHQPAATHGATAKVARFIKRYHDATLTSFKRISTCWQNSLPLTHPSHVTGTSSPSLSPTPIKRSVFVISDAMPCNDAACAVAVPRKKANDYPLDFIFGCDCTPIQVALWNQRLAAPWEDVVVWDYHVVLLLRVKAKNLDANTNRNRNRDIDGNRAVAIDASQSAEMSWIYDLDSVLDDPCPWKSASVFDTWQEIAKLCGCQTDSGLFSQATWQRRSASPRRCYPNSTGK